MSKVEGAPRIASHPSSLVPHPSSRWEERWRALISGQSRGLRAGAARLGLSGLAGLYGGVMSAYRSAYRLGLIRTVAPRCRVISIGNLTVGGTGKSTTVRWLAARLRDHGVPVAVLSYGYHGKSDESVTVVSDGERVLVPASISGDEPRMLAEALPGVPVLVGKRRQLAAAAAVDRFGVRVCVLDDAFQYWRLAKDLDVVLLDARDPFGGGHLLPRGLLREGRRQLRRARAIVLTNAHRLSEREKDELRRQVRRLSPDTVLAEARHAPRPLRPLGEGVRCRVRGVAGPCTPGPAPFALAGRRVLALSSLGNPLGFEQLVAEQGGDVVPERFPDHHGYCAEELRAVAERAQAQQCVAIVTTEKDAVKIDPAWSGAVPVWVLPVELEFDAGQGKLEALVDEVIETRDAE